MPFLREQSGRWSPVKIAAFAGSLAAGDLDCFPGRSGDLGARPVTEAIHQSGDWTLRLLLITLAVTPAQRILQYPAHHSCPAHAGGWLRRLRRPAHLLYVLDQHFDLIKVGERDRAAHLSDLIGALALAGLIALAVTSTDAAIRRLGSQRWNLLHRLVYAIALLAAVHFFIQSKLNIYEPMLMAGFLLWLLAFRALFWRNGEVTPAHLFLLAVAVAAATAAGEALIYMFTSGVDGRRVLLAHFDFDMEVRPAWWVLASGLAVAGVATWRYKPKQTRRRRIVPQVMRGAAQAQTAAE